MSYTVEQVEELERIRAAAIARSSLKTPAAGPRVAAKGREAPDPRNKTERDYGARLEAKKRAGDILDYGYEGMTFKLASDCRYTPDYWVLAGDGLLELHECKGGFIRDDGRDKLKVAARLFPFLTWFRAQRKDGRWTVTEIKTW